MQDERKGHSVGTVVIGRNEGERLVRCLQSISVASGPVVYVDSGSIDGSVPRAVQLGVDVVAEVSAPFSAGRARNRGVSHLLERHRDELRYVQFVDGDCEVDERWIEHAANFLDLRPDVGVVCGRVRERFPERTIYNRLADMEWDGPLGEIEACGGNAMVRIQAFLEVGGFDADIIAGEEPELHLRLRRAGYRIWRLEHEMALHDIAMESFDQWWWRSVRAGHSYAEGAYLHGLAPEHFRLREVASIVGYGGALPILALILAPPSLGASLTFLGLGYGGLWLRTFRRERARRGVGASAALYATSCTVGKFAQMQGVAQYALTRLVLRRRGGLIEHKRVAGHSSRASTAARFSRQSGIDVPSADSVPERSSTE